MCFPFRCWPARKSSPPTARESVLHASENESGVAVVLPSLNTRRRLEKPEASTSGYQAVDVSEDVRALREIFGTSSPALGSHAIAPIRLRHAGPRSRDSDSQLAARSPAKLSNNRLEALGQNIKQKLSDSRLSKNSSKTSIKAKDKQHESSTPAEQTPFLAVSYRSTGLDDLLVSRTVSEGGYDSDAKGIQIPGWREPSLAGSVKITPESDRRALFPLERLSEMTSPSCGSPCQPIDNSKVPEKALKEDISLSRDSGNERSDDDTDKANQETLAFSRLKKAHSFPAHLSTPSRTSFAAVLQSNIGDSPTELLRRLSLGVNDGSIELPDTPEFKAISIPSLSEGGINWRFSFPTPRRASTVGRNEGNIKKTISVLNATIEKLKRESVSSAPDHRESSLWPSLDPVLLDFLRRIDDSVESDEGHWDEAYNEHSKPETSLPTVSSPNPAVSNPNLGDSSPVNPTVPGINSGSHEMSPSGSRRGSTDKNSIHLFHMRISQRLGSNGSVAVLSSKNSNLASSNEHGFLDGERSLSLSSINRFPIFTTQEHLRRPSDPKTREIFEKTDTDDPQRRAGHKWKAVTSVSVTGHSPLLASHANTKAVKSDPSSFYMSDEELPISQLPSSANVNPMIVLKNPNSRAIGGRQASGGLGQRSESLGQLSNAEENLWLRPGSSCSRKVSGNGSTRQTTEVDDQRGDRFNSLPEQRNHIDRAHHPREDKLRHRKMTSSSTEANENMSQISAGAGATAADEEMSEVGIPGLEEGRGLGKHDHGGSSLDANEEWLTGRIRTNDNCFSNERDVRKSRSARDSRVSEGSAVSVWERALLSVRNDEAPTGFGQNSGLFLGVPGWHEMQQRRSARNSTTDEVRSGESLEPLSRTRSFSQDGLRSLSIDDHQKLCVDARRPLSRAPTMAISKVKNRTAAGDGLVPRKKSILDIRRFTTTGLERQQSQANKDVQPKEFLNWARFPSHTRHERGGAAGKEDAVDVRDFCSPADDGAKNKSQLSLRNHSNLSTTNLAQRTPGSWSALKFGGKRKNPRSKSMTLSKSTKKMLRRGSPWWKWRGLVRSHSSDLLRLGAGHRSSISRGAPVEYPELEIIPGLFATGLKSSTWGSGAAKRDVFQGLHVESRRQSSSTTRKASSGRESPGTPTPMPGRRTDRSRSGMSESEEVENAVNEGSVRAFPAAHTRRSSLPLIPATSVSGGNAWTTLYADCVSEWPKSPSTNSVIAAGLPAEGDSLDSMMESRGGGMDGGGGNRGKRILTSPELRGSTVDFRDALLGEEERLREQLLLTVQRSSSDPVGEVQAEMTNEDDLGDENEEKQQEVKMSPTDDL